MPKPRILVNSLPKSGTHLLAQAVSLCGYREHFADDGNGVGGTPLFLNYREARDALALEPPAPENTATVAVGALASWPVPLPSLRRWLEAVPEGRHLLGHLPWTPLLPPLLAELGYRHVFILRDPRAVAVSLLAFILDSGKMPHRHFLEADLKDLPAARRLEFLLGGGWAPHAGLTIPAFTELYRSMLGWREDAGCLCLRYEDLVGEAGGGSAPAQRAAFAQLAAHLGLDEEEANAARATEIYNPEARTFRTGHIDGWRRQLDAADLARLEAVCTPLRRSLGYGDET